MRITQYRFGRVTVDGTTYREDVVVLPDRVLSPWWRRTGHRLAPEDLAGVDPPCLLVVGTGAHGVLRVPEETRRALEARGFEVRVAPTARAVELFNGLAPEVRAAAALHLTC